MDRWDAYFWDVAVRTAAMSKDPRTKVGCVLAKHRRIVGTGFNGFPSDISDNERLNDRELKNQIIIHAEINAVLNAVSPPRGATAYVTTLFPCPQCASVLIQGGITRVVTRLSDDPSHAKFSPELVQSLFKEAWVRVEYV